MQAGFDSDRNVTSLIGDFLRGFYGGLYFIRPHKANKPYHLSGPKSLKPGDTGSMPGFFWMRL